MGLLDDAKKISKSENIEDLRAFSKENGCDMTDEQLKAVAGKLADCKTDEDLANVIGGVGFELSDKMLNAVANGGCGDCYSECSRDNWNPL